MAAIQELVLTFCPNALPATKETETLGVGPAMN